MTLYIAGSKKGALNIENTNFATDFHLYATIQNPLVGPQNYQLQPTLLTCRAVGHKPEDRDWTRIEFANAPVLTNNLE